MSPGNAKYFGQFVELVNLMLDKPLLYISCIYFLYILYQYEKKICIVQTSDRLVKYKVYKFVASSVLKPPQTE